VARRLGFRVGALIAPFVLAGLGERALVSTLAAGMARSMTDVAAAIDGFVASASRDRPAAAPAPEDAETPDDAARGELRRAPSGAPGRATIVVPARRLLRLTAHELAGIDARPAVDASGRTEGLSLRGVQLLGLGIHEGDIVTSIDGRPVATKETAIAAAVSAWKSGERFAHAVLLRHGLPVAVSVEVPIVRK